MNTQPTLGQRTAEWIGYQLAVHPPLRRVATLWLTTQLLAIWAVVAAPPAAASTLAGALNWTGITDSYGVPAGDLYLSVVSTSEAITQAGPHIDANPASWARWLANAVTTGVSHQTVIELLQAEAAAYIFMITMALWLLRFAMSSTWLYWLATWFRPLFEVIRTVLAELWVFPICLLFGLGVGAYHIIWNGRKGYGSGIMLSSFAIGILGIALTRDPLTELYSENGLLNQARNLGFSVAQAAYHNGPIAPGGSQAQLQHLTGLIADATLRMPLQLMNFGQPIDNIGTCANAYSAALLTGQPDAPAHAMKTCGAPQALGFAQHLSGANLALGGFFALLGLIFTVFVFYVTYSYVMVATAAFVNAFLVVINVGPAMIHGRPRRRAGRRVKQFFKHAGLVFAYVTYISFAALIVLRMASRGGYADQVGMTHPVARLCMIALVSVVAIGVFWWLKREVGDHTREELTHLVTDLAHHARNGYDRGQQAYDRARTLDFRRNRRRSTDQQSDSGDHPDEPLTGRPVPGRPPGGRPPTAPRGRRPAPGPGRPPAPAAAQPGGGRTPTPATNPVTGAGAATGAGAGSSAGAAAGAARAGAAVVAPEVVIGATIAAEAGRRLHNNRPTNSGATSRPTVPAPPPAPAEAPPPVAGRAPASSASGRRQSSRPSPQRRDHHETDARRDDDRPVQGR